MASNFIPQSGFSKITSKLEGITVYAPTPEKDTTPEKINFKCPQCGATTSYKPSISGVSCSNCGYAHASKAERVGLNAVKREFTLDNLALAARGWGVERSEIHCDSCGAEFSVATNALSSTCPFCASNRVIARVASQEILRPRFLIPFTLEAVDCQQKIKKWLGKGWMHPSDLSRMVVSTQLNGIYLPFWTFDTTIQANWRAEVGYKRTEKYYDNSSKSWKTRSRIDWRWESGQVTQKLNDWLGIGTTKVSHLLLKRLNLFDMNALTAYNPELLAGWPALNYDILLQEAWDSTKQEMREGARERCRKQIKSNYVRNFSMLADFDNESWRYILLPVYAAAYRFDKNTYQVLVNGQSGIISGQKPIAWWKVWLAIVGLLSPGIFMTFIGVLLLLFGGIGILILGLAVVVFIIGISISINIFRQAIQAGES
jgi:transcription elongation factor Elf1